MKTHDGLDECKQWTKFEDFVFKGIDTINKNVEQKTHTLISKVPKMNIFDCHYVCEHRMKFGGHGSNCIESIEESSKKNVYKLLHNAVLSEQFSFS